MAGRRKRVRFTLDVNFESDVAKEAFSDAVRNVLTPRGSPRLDNRELLLALFDCALSTHRDQGSETTDDLSAPSTGSFLRNAGLYESIHVLTAIYMHVHLQCQEY